MADDPNRDIFPLKEGSCFDICRSSIGTTTDPRERHFVCKLDRYQLEDRYLRVLDEVQDLKKLSNNQEDKIKRLATKLMRASAIPRVCNTSLDISNDKDRIEILELENAKLKDKACVLRNQLLSHKMMGRSPSRGRRPQTGSCSGATTCRSDSGRIKTPTCPHVPRSGNDDNDTQNYIVKIEELEAQRKELMSRINELENEQAAHKAGSQRERVAENVEYIRMWRQMKQNNDKLMATQNVNETLNAQISDLRKLLEETTKNNKDISVALVEEKKRMIEMDEQMMKAKDSQLSLREKDEQIRDLMNEMKILQQHNAELIALSSKYTQVETENVELRRRISEQLSDNQSLKSAFNTEQANIAALKAANEQLLGKLQELQKNMDSLTIQLVSFQNQSEKQDQATAEILQSFVKQVDREPTVTLKLSEESCIAKPDNCWKHHDEQIARTSSSEGKLCPCQCCDCVVDKQVQTMAETKNKTSQTEQSEKHVMQNPTSPVSPKTPSAKDHESSRKMTDNNRLHFDNESPLSREKMLKLLEQAQINTPLEAQNAAKMRQIEGSCALTCSGLSEPIQRNSQRQVLALETLLFGKTSFF